jgi:hypothetical protein
MGLLFERQNEDDIDDWTSQTDGAHTITRDAAAALGGTSGGIKVAISGTGQGYVRQTFTWSSGDDFGARFYFDSTGLAMGTDDDWKLTRIYDTSSSVERLQIIVGYNGTLFFVNASVWVDGDTEERTADYTFDDGEHYFEIYMKRHASAGSLKLKLDGDLKETISSLAIDTISRPNATRVGIVGGMDSGTSGYFYVDEVVFRDDDTDIGGLGPNIVELAGTMSAAAQFDGVMRREISLEGTCVADASGMVGMQRDISLAGSAAAAAQLSGVMRREVALAGAASAAAQLSGVMRREVALAGSAAAAAQLSGVMRREVALAGAASAAAQLSGVMRREVALAGAASAAAQLAGVMRREVSLAGSAVAKGAFSGTLEADGSIAGTMSAKGTFSGVLRREVALAGSMSAKGTFSGVLRRDISLAGSASAAAQLAGVMRREVSLAGSAVAKGAFSGTLEQPGAVFPGGPPVWVGPQDKDRWVGPQDADRWTI